jgi:hypothetical protein
MFTCCSTTLLTAASVKPQINPARRPDAEEAITLLKTVSFETPSGVGLPIDTPRPEPLDVVGDEHIGSAAALGAGGINGGLNSWASRHDKQTCEIDLQ